MWNQMDQKEGGGGGFMNSPGGQFGSPSVAGSADRRPDRIQNVVPVQCSTVNAVPADQSLAVAGQEVHMAVLCGRLEAVDRAATKLTYTLSDPSGAVTAVRWLDAEAGDDVDAHLAEGMLCRMVARVRPGKGGGPPAVMCYHLQPASEPEQHVHRLECQHAALKIAHVRQLEEGGAVSSAVGVGGGGEVPTVAAGGVVGLTPQQQAVYGSIHASSSEQGVHRDLVYSSIGSKMSRSEVDRIIEYLSNEGHVYNTTDDDHFKATDC